MKKKTIIIIINYKIVSKSGGDPTLNLLYLHSACMPALNRILYMVTTCNICLHHSPGIKVVCIYVTSCWTDTERVAMYNYDSSNPHALAPRTESRSVTSQLTSELWNWPCRWTDIRLYTQTSMNGYCSDLNHYQGKIKVIQGEIRQRNYGWWPWEQ